MLNFGVSLAGLYSNKLYAFGSADSSEHSLQSEEKHIPPILFIGREHCYECVKEFPMGKLEEVKSAALCMDDVAPFEGVNYFIIEPINSEKTQVIFFTIRKSVYEKFSSKAWVILPESMMLYGLLHSNPEFNSLSATLNDREIRAYQMHDGFKSLLVNKQNSNLMQVAQYSMVATDKKWDLSGVEYKKSLIKQLPLLPKYCYQQIINKTYFVNKSKKIPFKLLSGVSAVVFFTYLSLTSGWLYFQQQNLTTQLTEQRELLDEVFALQASYNDELSFQDELINNSKLSIVTSDVWGILISVIKNEAELLSVSFVDNEYVIRIKAQKSTEIIEFLSQNRQISTPVVVSPVIQSQGREIVTVKFSLLATEDVNAAS